MTVVTELEVGPVLNDGAIRRFAVGTPVSSPDPDDRTAILIRDVNFRPANLTVKAGERAAAYTIHFGLSTEESGDPMMRLGTFEVQAAWDGGAGNPGANHRTFHEYGRMSARGSLVAAPYWVVRTFLDTSSQETDINAQVLLEYDLVRIREYQDLFRIWQDCDEAADLDFLRSYTEQDVAVEEVLT